MLYMPWWVEKTCKFLAFYWAYCLMIGMLSKILCIIFFPHFRSLFKNFHDRRPVFQVSQNQTKKCNLTNWATNFPLVAISSSNSSVSFEGEVISSRSKRNSLLWFLLILAHCQFVHLGVDLGITWTHRLLTFSASLSLWVISKNGSNII